jgi:uncharacterized membrane protein
MQTGSHHKVFKYVTLLLFLLIVDGVWLYINRSSYNATVKAVQGSSLQLSFVYGLITYTLVFLSITLLCIPLIELSIKNKMSKLVSCILYGGGTGLCIYGIFNFTNMSIFRNYTLSTAVKDTLWGCILYSIATYVYISL